jgi:alkylation response protein AidB-like acyl-CoA dehydrogenase
VLHAGVATATQQLRQSVRSFLAAHWSVSTARSALAGGTPEMYDQLWRAMARQGLLGLHLPESTGGQGGGIADLTVTMEEAGRVLLGTGYLSSMVAVTVLHDAGDARSVHALVNGDLRCAVALQPAPMEVRCRGASNAVTVRGTVNAVADAEYADALLVAARQVGSDEAVLALVPCGEAVHRTRRASLDATRPIARVTFDDAPAEILRGGAAALSRALDAAALLIAADCTGVAQSCLEAATAHVRSRVAFGRTLASFQAIKHRCATMYVLVEASRAAVEAAASSSDSGDADAGALASMACALALDSAVEIATESVLLHGGIGFTWEHDAHLYLRRARAAQALSGGAAWHRRRLLDQIGSAEDAPS